jgi:hypothetical protein
MDKKYKIPCKIVKEPPRLSVSKEEKKMAYNDFRNIKEKKKLRIWFKIIDLENPNGKYLNKTEMQSYAKRMLSINKKVHGLDRDIKSKDLDDLINAWVYLRNIGLGHSTNHILQILY